MITSFNNIDKNYASIQRDFLIKVLSVPRFLPLIKECINFVNGKELKRVIYTYVCLLISFHNINELLLKDLPLCESRENRKKRKKHEPFQIYLNMVIYFCLSGQKGKCGMQFFQPQIVDTMDLFIYFSFADIQASYRALSFRNTNAMIVIQQLDIFVHPQT